jgi:hypothetical protein
MPRYFFHVYEAGLEVQHDRQGLELADLSGARAACAQFVAEVLAESEFRDLLSADREFRVFDESGKLVLTVPFLYRT